MTNIYLPPRAPRELPSAGTQFAVCYGIVDLGTQGTTYGPKPQVMVQFEMLDETASNGKPLLLSRRYTMSADPKSSLRQDLESWLGRTLSDEEIARIDLSRFLGEAALLAIRHEARGDKIFANITSVLKPPSGREQKARPDTPMVAFSLQQRPFDGVGFARLPQWLQTVIANAPEYKRARDAVPLSAGWPSRCVVSWKPLLLHPCHMLNHSPVPQRANTLYLLLLAVSGC
jgi:hypothetical protein